MRSLTRLSLASLLSLSVMIACLAPATTAPAALTATVVTTAAVTPAAEPTGTPVARTATLSELRNSVDMRTSQNAAWAAASDGEQIASGGGARTGGDSHARIDTSDGSIVRIASDSVFLLQELSPQATDPVTRLQLTAGTLWAFVTKALGGGEFAVKTPVGVATVRGSLISVAYDPASGRMLVTCLDGHCALSDLTQPPNVVQLTGGQGSEIRRPGQPPAPPSPMDDAQIHDWIQNFPEAIDIAQNLLATRPTAAPTSGAPQPGGTTTWLITYGAPTGTCPASKLPPRTVSLTVDPGGNTISLSTQGQATLQLTNDGSGKFTWQGSGSEMSFMFLTATHAEGRVSATSNGCSATWPMTLDQQ